MTTNFHNLTISEVCRETAEAVSITFRVPDDLKQVFTFKPGQYLTLRTALNGEEIRRTYSLCAAPHEDRLKIAVKQVAGGRFSTWANAELKAGARLDVMPAAGRFTWDFAAGEPRRFVCIAAGSGITPVLSLLKSALTADPACHVTLLYGNRSSSSILFLDELADLKNRFMGRLAIYHFLSAEEDEIGLFNGRLEQQKFDEIFSHLIDPKAVEAFFICGPAGVMDAAETSLHPHGVAADRILTERFTANLPTAQHAATVAALAEKAAGIRFTVILDGRRRGIDFNPARQNLLDSARDAGLPAPFACKAGVCATCRARLLSGQIEMASHYGLSESERAQGYILTCQAVPLSDDVVVDYDA